MAGIAVKVRDSICCQVSNRERNAQHFAAQHDIIIFVSGTRSSNGRNLYKTCKKVHSRTYFVARIEDLCSYWFNESEKIGVCGATSTPKWLMEEVRDHIFSLVPCG